MHGTSKGVKGCCEFDSVLSRAVSLINRWTDEWSGYFAMIPLTGYEGSLVTLRSLMRI